MQKREPARARGSVCASRLKTADRADDVPPLGRALDFLRLLWALDHGLQRNSKRMLQAVGVTGPQRLVIRIVGRFPGISAGGLARIVHLHPSTLSGVLERLERRQLVQRRSDARDKRRALFRLTAKGRTVDERSTGTIESAVAGAIVKLPRAKLEAASEVLEALAGSLEGTRRRARRPSRSTD